jgi:uncharacterized protein (TIGR03437 family)
VRDGWVGPSVTVAIADVSPGLFQNENMAAAGHLDGSPVNSGSPARPGEVIVLYGTGLGQTVAQLNGQDEGFLVPLTADTAAIRIRRCGELAATLNDAAPDSPRILWAGLTPGFAGLYQVNLQLPDSLEPDPLIRIWIGDQGSAPGIRLAARP